MKFIKLFPVFLLCVMLVPEAAQAFGKKRNQPPQEPADTTPYPVRDITMGEISKTPFLLPDGKTPVDMSIVLPQLVQAVLAERTTKFRIHPGGGENKGRFIFEGGVVSFEASIFEGKIKFGYKPGSGDIGDGVLTGVEGEVKVTIGSLGVAFRVIDTQRGNETVASAMGDALAGGGSLTVTLDFGPIKAGPDFVLNPQMSKIFKRAISRSIDAMVANPRTNFEMDWNASVTRVDRDSKRVFFNSGMRDEIVPNNVFRVYDGDDRLIGLLKARETDHEFSSGDFKDDADGKKLNSVREGDPVKIYFNSIPGRPGH